MLFYILSLSRLGSISQGLGQWHASLYLITPWQYTPRLGMLFYIYHALAVFGEAAPRLGMSFCILSRLGSSSGRLRPKELAMLLCQDCCSYAGRGGRFFSWCVGARHTARAVRP